MYVENQIASLRFSSTGQVQGAERRVPKTNSTIKQAVNFLHRQNINPSFHPKYQKQNGYKSSAA